MRRTSSSSRRSAWFAKLFALLVAYHAAVDNYHHLHHREIWVASFTTTVIVFHPQRRKQQPYHEHRINSPFQKRLRNGTFRNRIIFESNQKHILYARSRSSQNIDENMNTTSTEVIDKTSSKQDLESTPAQQQHTNAILRISYDGTKFTGWSGANGRNDMSLGFRKSRQSRHKRKEKQLQEFAEKSDLPKGFVRSVEGAIKINFAKLYGDVDPSRVIVEGCSRTDKGVHASGMVAQFYCLKEDCYNQTTTSATNNTTIPGKRIPHPKSSTDDSSFESLPMNGNLTKIAFAFNRMKPPDVQLTGIALSPMPSKEVFHASLSSQSKTYEYKIATGAFADPTLRRLVWHAGYRNINLGRMQEACRLLKGTHDFSAFEGSARGHEDKQKQNSDNRRSPICTISEISIQEQDPVSVHNSYYFEGVDPKITNYRILVKGDRFLYKMIRFIVGALVAIGYGKLQLTDLDRALDTGNWKIPNDSQERRFEFECAPPHGLTLTQIDYGEDIFFDWQPLR